MNNCIKTGARVYIEDYNLYVPADLFLIGESVVVNIPPGAMENFVDKAPEDVTHWVPQGSKYYLHKDKGILVIYKYDIVYLET